MVVDIISLLGRRPTRQKYVMAVHMKKI